MTELTVPLTFSYSFAVAYGDVVPWVKKTIPGGMKMVVAHILLHLMDFTGSHDLDFSSFGKWETKDIEDHVPAQKHTKGNDFFDTNDKFYLIR